MKFKLLLLLLLLSFSSSYAALFNFSKKENKVLPITLHKRVTRDKKKVIVFTSDGGGGHRSVSRALKQYLEPSYDVTNVNIIKDILPSMDPIKWVSRGKYSGEDLYNYFLKKGWIWATNELCAWGKRAVLFKRRAIEKYVHEYLDKEDPDMIASVMPIVNSCLLKEAEKKDIPFIIITNDLDTRNYLNGIKKPSYKKFKYLLTFKDEQVKSSIKKYKLKDDQIEFLGFPLRPDFYLKKDRNKLKREFNLPRKPTVMVLMGAAGSSKSYYYAQKLAQYNKPLHVIMCIGRNEKLRNKINKLEFNPNVSISIVGFTDRISDYMVASDAIITKPGPNSVSEALYSNLPMIIDNTSKTLFWEKLNIKFVKKNKLGLVLNRGRKLNKALDRYFVNSSYYKEVKNNMVQFKKMNFGVLIKDQFDRMLKA